MKLRCDIHRLGRTLVSLGLGITLVCGALLLIGLAARPAIAAPAPPPLVNGFKLTAQAMVPVTTTIQAAINAALPGDTVVFTNTYTETVVINKPLTLQGSSLAATIVYSGASQPTLRLTSDNITVTNMTLLGLGTVSHDAIRVENSGNINITGVSIQNYPTGIEVERTGASPTGITITNNIIHGNPGGIPMGGGIYFHGLGGGIGPIQAVIQSNQVSGYILPPHLNFVGLAPTLIANNVLTAPGASPNGLIYLDQSGPAVIRNNRLAVATSIPFAGIRLTGSANPTVTQNILDSLIQFGIEVDGTATPVITNSLLVGHGIYGLHIHGDAQPRVLSTTLLNNFVGINIAGNAQPQILNNVITGSATAGILANPTVTPTIGYNRLINNGVSIVYNSPTPLTTFAFGNTLCRNNLSLNNTSGITLSFTGNWWGHNPPLDTDSNPPSDWSGDPVNTNPVSMALTLNPTPALIPVNGAVAVTLTMRGGGYNVLDGTPIQFTATAGSFSVNNTATSNGLATTIYTGTTLGAQTITATDECGGFITATIIIGEPVLTTTKTAVPPPGSSVRPGQPITYTIYVTNTGAYTATGVVFSDTVPAFTTLAGAAINSGVITPGNPVTALFNPIPPNNGVMSVTMRVTVTLPLTNGTWLTNTASISYFNGTTDIITPTNAVTHGVASSPNLTLTKTAQPLPGSVVRPGEIITYTLTLTNQGDANTTSVVISDTFPVNTQFEVGTSIITGGGASGTSFTLPGDGSIRFEIDYLPAPTGIVTATFHVRVGRPLTDATIITNTAQVTSSEVATITYSNAVTHEVESSPNLTITKTANPPHGSTVFPGQTITYTLTVTNIGDAIASNVVVTDTVPQYTNYVSAMPGVSFSGGVITWNTITLTIDTPVSAYFVVAVTTPLTNNTLIANTGYVTFTGSPVVTPSNTVTHLVQSSPQVTYTKIAQPPAGSSLNLSLVPLTQITYTIIVTNNGNANATGLTITDTVPANTTGSGLTPWFPDFLVGNGGVTSTTFVVTVNVPLSDLTVITNVYQVSYNEISGMFGPTSPLSPTNVVTHLIRSQPVISAVKTATPPHGAVVTPGQVITYSFTVTNSGTATATNFVLSDAVPANTTYITNSASASPGAVVNQSPSTVTAQVDLPTLGVLTFTFAARVNNPLPNNTPIQNFGQYTFDQAAAPTQTNVVTHRVQSAPDITLTKTAVPPHGAAVTPGDRITYTITITNNGSADATNAVLADTVPTYTQYVTGTASPAPASTSPLVWNLPSILGAGGVTAVTFAVQVDLPLTNGLTISNSALLDITETTGLSQTNVVTHLVQSSVAITLTKAANPPSGSQVAPGDTITYTLTAANTGTQLATGVRLTDTLPAEVIGGSVSGSRAPAPSLAGNQVTWNIGTLTANEIVTATISVTVRTPLTRGLVITNQGQLLTAQTGLSTTNFVTHTVISTPTLTLVKTAAPPSGSPVFPGSIITYTITVTNSGNGPATSFLITDTVPLSTSLTGGVTASPGFTTGSAGNTLTVNGTLGAGQAMSVTFAAVLTTTGLANGAILTNTGYVGYAESAVISPTNPVTHMIRLTPALTLTKLAQPPGPTIGAGQTITYTVLVTNNDTLPATSLVLTDFIPANTSYVLGSAATSAGSISNSDPLTVTVGALTGTMSFTFQVTVNSPITNGVIITNVAELSAEHLSPVQSNFVTHTVVSLPDLVITKSAAPPSESDVDPADPILYRIRVINNGSGPATNLIITDTMPISTEFVMAALIPPSIGSVTGPDPMVVTVPSLAGGGGQMEFMLLVTVTNNAPSGLLITNTARVSSHETVVTTTNVVTHRVGLTPVLTGTKTAVPAPGSGIRPGDPVTYTVTLTNTGTATLTNLMLVDLLDANTSWVSSTPLPSTPFVFGPVAMWASLSPGNSVSLVLRVTASPALTAGAVITNLATGSSTETPIIVTNLVTHVIAMPVVVITKTDQVTIVRPGDRLTYTLTISNEGNTQAGGLVITDTVPVNTTYVPGSASGGGVYITASREITWAISSLATGGQLTRTFVVMVDNPAPLGVESITNTVIITGNGSPATAQDIDLVDAAPNLLIRKAASGLTEPGAVITYTLTYTNIGNQAAPGVIISDTVPPYTRFNAGVSTPGWSCADDAPAGANCMLNIGVVNGGNAGGSVTFAVTVTTPLSGGEVISNIGYITHGGTTVITPSNTVTHVVQVRPILSLFKSANPPHGASVSPGDPITYTLTLSNTGTGAATGVVITDTLDPNVQSAGPNPLVLSGGTVTPGFTISFTVRVTVTSPLTNGQILYNQIQAASTEVPTPTLSNLVTHTVVSTPNLIIAKYALAPAGSIVDPGDGINYLIQVLNTGNAPVTNLRITDTWPVSTTFSSAWLIPPTGTISIANPVVATIPTLAGNGGAVSFLLWFIVDAAAPPGLVIPNTAQVVSDQTPLTNTNTITHQVTQPAALTLFKTADPPNNTLVTPGQTITYTLTVINAGPGPANNMVLTDTLPGGVGYVGGSISASTGFSIVSPPPGLVVSGTLPPGNMMTTTFRVTVTTATSGTILTNTARVSATTTSPVVATTTHRVVNPVYTMTIAKNANPLSGSMVDAGQIITYTVTVTNTGDPMSNVVISDTLDPSVTLVTSNIIPAGSLSGPNPVRATGISLATGDVATLTLGVRVSTVPTGTIIRNQASVTSTQTTLQSSGLVTHVVSNTIPIPSLAITKTAIPASGSFVSTGDLITYTITARNTGSGAATGVVISDTLDPNVTLVTSSTTTGTVSGPNPLRLTIPNLGVGGQVTLTLRVQVTGTVSSTVISNRASVTSTEILTPQVSAPVVTHIISNTPVVSPSFTIFSKSANPVGGTTVVQNQIITYTITVVNSGGMATGAVLTDAIPANTAYVLGSATTTLGTASFDGTRVIVTATNFLTGTTMTVNFRVRVTTNSTTTLSNQATFSSNQTPLQSSNVITHAVQGITSPGGGAVYLPIILKNYEAPYIALQWDNVEPVRDRVRDLDGGAGLCLHFPCDGQVDGVFKLYVNVGSTGPKTVSTVRLISSQGVEWDTIPGNGRSVLGIFNGMTMNNHADGSINGILFNSGLIQLHLFASDDAGYNRFRAGQYIFTVIINFTDGSSMTAQTATF